MNEGDEQTHEERIRVAEGQVLQVLDMRAMNYRRTFHDGVDPQNVLQDLAKFCRANESTFHSNVAIAQRLDGRREVWLRIQQHLQMTPEQLWRLYQPR